MRLIRFISLVLIAALLPLAVFAQSVNSTADISALLSQITALEQQISSLSAGASATTSVSTSSSVSLQPTSGTCPVLGRTLSLGASGEDVQSLQVFLIQQGLLDASATGYFGALTQAAVGQWQESHSVVSGGDAASTGLGVVGPKTRAAISSSCGGSTTTQTSTNSQCLPTNPPQLDCPGNSWQPVLDAAGCVMYYQCSVPLPGAGTSATSTSSTSNSSSNSCPVVTKPSCTGQVEPFQTNANGCVLSYQCVI